MHLASKDLPDISETGYSIIVKVPAMPEKGFKWPYLLRIPTKTYKELNNKAEKRYLMFEMANIQTVQLPGVERIMRESLQNTSGSSFQLAEKLWAPAMTPLIPRTYASYRGGANYEDHNSVFEHQLDRDIIMLEKLKEDASIGPQIINSYYDYGYDINDYLNMDKQVLAMIDHAIEYLNKYGHNVEDKILIGGDSASGHFSNRFSALYPERVKASSAGLTVSGILIPASNYKGEELIYPIGLAEYKEITGKEFSLEDHNKVARIFYYGKKDSHDALSPSDVYGNRERNLIIKLFGEHLDNHLKRLRNRHKAYKEVGGQGIFVYMDDVGHNYSQGMIDYLLEFYKANIRSETPVYKLPRNGRGLEVEIYR